MPDPRTPSPPPGDGTGGVPVAGRRSTRLKSGRSPSEGSSSGPSPPPAARRVSVKDAPRRDSPPPAAASPPPSRRESSGTTPRNPMLSPRTQSQHSVWSPRPPRRESLSPQPTRGARASVSPSPSAGDPSPPVPPRCGVNPLHTLRVLSPSDVVSLKCVDCHIQGSAAAGMRRRLYECADCSHPSVFCKVCLALRCANVEERTGRKQIAADQLAALRPTVLACEEARRGMVEGEAADVRGRCWLEVKCAYFEEQEETARRAATKEAAKAYSVIMDGLDPLVTEHHALVRGKSLTVTAFLSTPRRELDTHGFIEKMRTALGLHSEVLRFAGIASVVLPTGPCRDLPQLVVDELAAEPIARPPKPGLPAVPLRHDECPVALAADLSKRLLAMAERKAGDVFEELACNLITPECEEQGKAAFATVGKYVLLYDLAEAFKARSGRSNTGRASLACLVLALYTSEGPDIDRFMGFEDAPPPRKSDESVEGEWKSYTERVGETRNPSIRDAINRKLHLWSRVAAGDEGYEAAEAGVRQWVHFLGAVIACLSTKTASSPSELIHACRSVKPGLLDYYKMLEEGAQLAWPGLIAASRCDHPVKSFAECNGDGLCLILLQAHETVMLQDVSVYKGEEEVVLRPLSTLTVERVKTGASGVVLNVSVTANKEADLAFSEWKKRAALATASAQARFDNVMRGAGCQLTLRLHAQTVMDRPNVVALWEFLVGRERHPQAGLPAGVDTAVFCDGTPSRSRHASCTATTFLEKHIEKRDNPPKMLPAIQLFTAVAEDDVAGTLALLADGPCDPFDPKLCEAFSGSALHIACNTREFCDPAFGDPGLTVLRTLVNPSADVMWHYPKSTTEQLISSRDFQGDTPLHIALREGFATAVELLLDAGAAIDERNDAGRLPLHYAVSNDAFLSPERSAIVAKLITAESVEAPDTDPKDNGKTPLLKAAEKRALCVVQLLHEHGAKLDAVDQLGRTPLHYAVEACDFDTIDYLLDNGADVSAVQEGKTCLEKAADMTGYHTKSKSYIIRRLTTPAAEDWACSQDGTGRTPLHNAGLAGRVHLVEALLDSGAVADTPDVAGKCALQTVIEYGEGDRETREALVRILSASTTAQLPKKVQDEVKRILNSRAARKGSASSSGRRTPSLS
ncbi:hypothetical protein DIPPA_02679 [Diplonema papillatum]|nr:hypothetical protein DIPPA_02679 [Diplonema papillatum]